MPNPELINGTYYLRLHVPRDIAKVAEGTSVAVPVGEAISHGKVGLVVKVSLRTKDAVEAKRRFIPALNAVERHWESLRNGPVSLTHKQCVALGGEVYRDFIGATDEDPGSFALWERIRAADAYAKAPRLEDELTVPLGKASIGAIEARFGHFADVTIRRYGLNVTAESRWKVVLQVAQSLEKASAVIMKKANGDYSESGATSQFPEFEQPVAKQAESAPKGHAKTVEYTLLGTVAEQVRRRALGSDAKPFPQKSINKFEQVAKEFAAHRGSVDIRTITPREVDAWKVSMMEVGELSNVTISQRLSNLGTIVTWAQDFSFGELFPNGNPVLKVKLPVGQSVRSEDRTLRISEAQAILEASRRQSKPELRWCPLLLAYSGARIGEITQLTREDFFQYGEDWFYRITTKGGKKVKVQASIRRVPIHAKVLDAGFLTYLTGSGLAPKDHLFPVRAVQNLHKWIRTDLKLDREDLAPNHGWRHLFEDLALLAGMQESAKRYITGRTTGHSSEGYGKSDAMLPALAAEMKKVGDIMQLGGGQP
jgi:integrase